MFFKNIFIKSFFSVLISIYLLINCTADNNSVDYIRSIRSGDFKARIVIDSSEIYRSNRNNGQLSVDIKYKAVLLDSEIDSIEWLFPGGNPDSEKEVLATSINYSDYGTFNSQLVLTKVDTVGLNKIFSYKDTIDISKPLEIIYKEMDWGSFTTTDNENWIVLPNNQNVIIRENQVFESNSPFESFASFKGFKNQKLKFKVDYKLSYKNPLANSITQNTKIEVLINDLKIFGVSGVTDSEYFTQEFYVNNLEDFDFKIRKPPSLSNSAWTLSLTSSGTTLPDVQLYDLVNQNKIVGYLNLEETSTSSETTLINAQLITSLNGTTYNFGVTNQQNIGLDGSEFQIKPGSNYKIIFKTEDGLPKSYEILNEDFTSIPVSLGNNEYYLDATFRKLYISIE
mgnify:FL=1